MKVSAVVCVSALFASCAFAQSTVDIGAGSPNEYIKSLFVAAYHRGNFAAISGGPTGPVRRFGTTGLIQEFNDATRTAGRMALVKASSLSDPTDPVGDVYQIATDMYAYFSSVGVGTAGYPIQDTLSCPGSNCQYQTFDKKYVLFVYASGANDTQTITLRDPFYTRWIALTGISGLGPATTAEQTSASSVGGTATIQQFANGALYNVTAGTLTGRFLSVKQPVWSLYLAQRAHLGPLGFPTGEEIVLPNGKKRQVFEGGAIEYDANSGPVLRVPVQSIVIRPTATPVRVNLGDTITLSATVYGQDGSELSDRTVVFTTSNSRVVSVQTSGNGATLRAVGGGTANITATSEGKTSSVLQVIVNAPCCQVGEGAPSTTILQAFQDAVTRNTLALKLPGAERVRRVGAGYVQEVSGLDGVRYLLAVSDKTTQGVVVAGPILMRYEELGGPSSSLGYPIADRVNGGRQLFEGGALAGTPVRVVAGGVLQKWALLRYEPGPAGSPVVEATAAQSFLGTLTISQAFQNGLIVSSTKGFFFVSGLIAAQYLALNAAAGSLGVPIGDELAQKQEFEGGAVEYQAGASEVKVTFRERRPLVTVNPSAILPGGRIHITVAGFADGANLRVSVSGQQDFIVRTSNGSYTWDSIVPAGAVATTIRIKATDISNTSIGAEAEYRVRAAAEVRARLDIVGGDAQSGAPGAVLAQRLRVSLKDEQGIPIGGVTVRFASSPGSQVEPASVDTDLDGVASAQLRLPLTEGVALVTAESLRQVVTFSARSTSGNLQQFPKFTQGAPEPLMLTASAAILRYYQSRGAVPAPNGLADADTLNRFLRALCTADSCDGILTDGPAPVVNLWRLPLFAGNTIEISPVAAELMSIRSAIGAGDPVLLLLSSGQVIVGMGIGSDGAVLVQDPVTTTAKRALEDYLTGGVTVTGALRFLTKTPSAESFAVLAWDSDIRLSSAMGECGIQFETRVGGASLRQRVCDGVGGDYQLELSGASRAVVIDLGEGGSRAEVAIGPGASLRISRPGQLLVVAPQQTTLAQRGIVNSATFTADIAPGTMIAIFGAGLSKTGGATRVTLGGRDLQIVAATPFQVNAVVPTDLAPGSYLLRAETVYGIAESPIDVRPLAPAIFRAGEGWAVVNADGKLNMVSVPARRGQVVVIYATGLGAILNRPVRTTTTPVNVLIRGENLTPAYAGPAPGYEGVYQINVAIPATFPVGTHSIVLSQAGIESAPANVTIQ